MTHPLRIPIHVSGRAKSNSLLYFRMCARALVHYRFLANELDKLPRVDPRYDDLFDRVEEAAVEPVIFAGMCLEATLYDLGACLFGNDFVDHTEKLDPIGKFVVVARLVDRRTPKPSSVTYQSLQALVSARNKLVHHKSQSMLEEEIGKILSRSQKEHDQHLNGIASSFKALVLLSLYFDGNIFEELRIIPSFKKPEHWAKLVPEQLHEDVKWCIQASRKERRNVESPNTAP